MAPRGEGRGSWEPSNPKNRNLPHRCILAKWQNKYGPQMHFRKSDKKGVEISDLDAREHVYGKPGSEWKKKYQK